MVKAERQSVLNDMCEVGYEAIANALLEHPDADTDRRRYMIHVRVSDGKFSSAFTTDLGGYHKE